MDSDARSDSAVTASLYARTACDVCSTAAARAVETGDVVECVCGRRYTPAHAPHASPRREPPRLVYVAPDEEPASGPRRPREARSSEPEGVTRLRRLLCALRPDKRGPFGWAWDGDRPSDERPSATPERVQATAEVPAIPADAFATAAAPTAGAALAVRLDREAGRLIHALTRLEGAELAAARVALRGVTALSWLQRNGTLRWGPDAVYRELAFSLGREEQVARWKSDAAGAARGAVVWGAARVDEAVATWATMDVVLTGRADRAE